MATADLNTTWEHWGSDAVINSPFTAKNIKQMCCALRIFNPHSLEVIVNSFDDSECQEALRTRIECMGPLEEDKYAAEMLLMNRFDSFDEQKQQLIISQLADVPTLTCQFDSLKPTDILKLYLCACSDNTNSFIESHNLLQNIPLTTEQRESLQHLYWSMTPENTQKYRNSLGSISHHLL